MSEASHQLPFALYAGLSRKRIVRLLLAFVLAPSVLACGGDASQRLVAGEADRFNVAVAPQADCWRLAGELQIEDNSGEERWMLSLGQWSNHYEGGAHAIPPDGMVYDEGLATHTQSGAWDYDYWIVIFLAAPEGPPPRSALTMRAHAS